MRPAQLTLRRIAATRRRMAETEEGNRQRAVAAYYDQLAPVYGEGAYFQARRAAVLDVIRDHIAQARVVLDLGCGNGAYVAELAARTSAARVIGADLSPEMLRAARQRLGERIPLVRADATALPFRPECFDLVFLSHVLLLVSSVERCIAEVARSLVPDGRLVATVGVTRWRQLIHEFVSLEEWRELEGMFGSGLRAGPDDQSLVLAACARAGVEPEWRDAAFAVTWPAVEEWVRIRWLTIADATRQARVERLLNDVRPRAAGLTFPLTETLLVARKP